MNGSPYDLLDPTSLHGLHMKKRFEMCLKAADLIPVIQANADIIPDDATRALFLEVLEGKLGKKRGRPKHSLGREGILVLADMDIKDRASEIREARKLRSEGEKCVRGELQPIVAAANEIAADYNMTGPALLNAISSQKVRCGF